MFAATSPAVTCFRAEPLFQDTQVVESAERVAGAASSRSRRFPKCQRLVAFRGASPPVTGSRATLRASCSLDRACEPGRKAARQPGSQAARQPGSQAARQRGLERRFGALQVRAAIISGRRKAAGDWKRRSARGECPRCASSDAQTLWGQVSGGGLCPEDRQPLERLSLGPTPASPRAYCVRNGRAQRDEGGIIRYYDSTWLRVVSSRVEDSLLKYRH